MQEKSSFLHNIRTIKYIWYNITENKKIFIISNKGDYFMKKILKKDLLYTLGSVVSAFALVVTTFNVNTTCAWIMHQDELPKSAKKLRKF